MRLPVAPAVLPPVFFRCLYSCVPPASRELPPFLPKAQDTGGKTAGATNVGLWFRAPYRSIPALASVLVMIAIGSVDWPSPAALFW